MKIECVCGSVSIPKGIIGGLNKLGLNKSKTPNCNWFLICLAMSTCLLAHLNTTTPAVGQSLESQANSSVANLSFKQLPGYAQFVEAKTKKSEFSKAGRVGKIRWSDDGTKFNFSVDGQRKQFNINDRQISPSTEKFNLPSPRNKVPPAPRVARAKQATVAVSPDKKWKASYRNHNVVITPTKAQNGEGSITVTVDGNSRHRYGTCCWVYGEELDQQTAMWWSPDSQKLAYYEVDESDMTDYYLTADNTASYTRLETVRYPKSGTTNPKVSLHIFDLPTRQSTKVQIDGPADQYLFEVKFSPQGNDLIFHRMERRQNKLDVMAADTQTGNSRLIVSESQATWQEVSPLMRFLDDGNRFIWETERSQWKHFELRDLSGRKIKDLSTFGNFPINKIEFIDEAADWIYYSAFSDPSNPYNLQLHRSQINGDTKQRITSAELNHSRFQISPGHHCVVATRERFDAPRSTAVYRCDSGEIIGVLADSSDSPAAKSLGIARPELFQFMANDGATKLFGTLHKPSNFDPQKKYPLLIDVYGGPQSKGITNQWSPKNPNCEFGFLIAKIGNRGTINRGKSFESANFRNLGGPDLDDQVSGVKFLCDRPYVDSNRVGIWGHSYGGYMSALGILKFPDVFHVAVSGAPVTDWKNYDTIYTERYMQVPEDNRGGYRASSCMKYARRLKGKLLLVHGLIDDNVHPANTWQLAKALQNADKRFDMMIYPGFRHGIGSTYDALRWEYFFKHLRPDLPSTASQN